MTDNHKAICLHLPQEQDKIQPIPNGKMPEAVSFFSHCHFTDRELQILLLKTSTAYQIQPEHNYQEFLALSINLVLHNQN